MLYVLVKLIFESLFQSSSMHQTDNVNQICCDIERAHVLYVCMQRLTVPSYAQTPSFLVTLN